MYYFFFIQSSVDGLGCFHVSAIITSAAMNTGAYVPFQIMVFSRYKPRSGADHKEALLFFKETPCCSLMCSSLMMVMLSLFLLFIFHLYGEVYIQLFVHLKN